MRVEDHTFLHFVYFLGYAWKKPKQLLDFRSPCTIFAFY